MPKLVGLRNSDWNGKWEWEWAWKWELDEVEASELVSGWDGLAA